MRLHFLTVLVLAEIAAMILAAYACTLGAMAWHWFPLAFLVPMIVMLVAMMLAFATESRP